MSAQTSASTTVLPDYVLRAIRGEMTEEEKHKEMDKSLSSWWKEYASRKNDEEEEHVADSLLYDERCHLPRTTPPPTLSDGRCVKDAVEAEEASGKK
ncbi:hypothetical protein HXX76_011702 [Chlamydomonas incerta]|uniref:Uncharacterized protein n=1 Tax=Chlamydomonas incerta TaxID=51695 RepID=A0A835SFW4_CHLIN|nr:hypothetical protein HXX76_011702 [Chlamydomonas incerta]|eukprot:KAG2426472.1 hypothetical protein HXX76_011702 [Chlamydomonas incerta]